MSLCRSPLRSIPETLAENLHSIPVIEKALNAALPSWKEFVEADDTANLPLETNESFALSKELLDNTYIPDSVQRKLRAATDDPTMLIDMRRQLLGEQVDLQTAFMDEVTAIAMENEQAAQRKIDYTPIIYNSIKELAVQGVLKDIVKDLIDNGEMEE